MKIFFQKITKAIAETLQDEAGRYSSTRVVFVSWFGIVAIM